MLQLLSVSVGMLNDKSSFYFFFKNLNIFMYVIFFLCI